MSSNQNPNEDHSHDKVFVRTFGVVLMALGGLFAFCMFAAGLIVPKPPMSESEVTRMTERVKPIGTVITDPSLLVKVSATKHAPLTGDQVVAQACGACHGTGVLGAPKIGDHAEWAKRLGAAGGIPGLLASAIKGKNSMPARGGNPDFTDDELKAAITLMSSK